MKLIVYNAWHMSPEYRFIIKAKLSNAQQALSLQESLRSLDPNIQSVEALTDLNESSDRISATIRPYLDRPRGVRSGTSFADLVPFSSKALRLERLSRGLSLKALGQLVGMNKGSLSKLENGKSSIGVDPTVAQRLRSILGENIFTEKSDFA